MRLSFGATVHATAGAKSAAETYKAEVVSIAPVIPGRNVLRLLFRWLDDSAPVCTPDKLVRVFFDREPGGYFSPAGDIGSGDTFSLCIKEKGEGSTARLVHLNPHDSVSFQVLSSGIPLPKANENIVLVANGSGIGLFRGLLQYIAQTQPDRSGTIYLLDGVHDASSILYEAELTKLAQQIGHDKCKIETVFSTRRAPDKKYVQHRFQELLGQPGEEPALIKNLRDPKTRLYICGHKDLASIEGMLEKLPAKRGGHIQQENLWQRMKDEDRLHVSVY